MWLLRLVLTLVLVALLVVVAVNNTASVELRLLGHHMAGVPLYLVVFGAAFFGLLLGLLLSAVREVQLRGRMRKLDKRRQQLEREVRELRAAPLDGLEAGPGGSDA